MTFVVRSSCKVVRAAASYIKCKKALVWVKFKLDKACDSKNYAATAAKSGADDPYTVQEAPKREDSDCWKRAIHVEFKAWSTKSRGPSRSCRKDGRSSIANGSSKPSTMPRASAAAQSVADHIRLLAAKGSRLRGNIHPTQLKKVL